MDSDFAEQLLLSVFGGGESSRRDGSRDTSVLERDIMDGLLMYMMSRTENRKPATKQSVIDALPVILLNDLTTSPENPCTICLDNFAVGETITEEVTKPKKEVRLE